MKKQLMKSDLPKARIDKLQTYLFFALALILGPSLSTPSFAAEYTFTSKLDRFTVEVNDGSATYNGESVNSEPFKLVKPLFDYELADACDQKMGRPDLTISRKRGDNEEKRLVYIEKRVVSDGTNCGEISGDGLYELPLHHNWFLESKKVTIGLMDHFSIWKDKKLVVEFKKKDGRWQNVDSHFFTNWKYFDKFTAAMKDIPIDFRVHPAAAKSGGSGFELRQGSRVFSFVKVGERTWAVKFPNSPWYSASGQFGFFEDMSANIWLSPYENLLRIVADPSTDVNSRITAIRSLNDKWGPDIKYAFYTILSTGGENRDVIKEIASVLRSKPSDDNYSALVDALSLSKDEELLNYISKILRLRNPKGPTIDPTDSETVIKEKVKTWREWRKGLGASR